MINTNQYSIVQFLENLLLWSKKIDKKLAIIQQENLTQKELLSSAEASLYSGLSPKTILNLTSAGEIPFYKPGNKNIWIRRTDIDKWITRNGLILKQRNNYGA